MSEEDFSVIASDLEYCGHLHVCHCEPEALGGRGNPSLL